MCDAYDFYKKVNFQSFPGERIFHLYLNLKQKSDWNKLEMDNVNLEDLKITQVVVKKTGVGI